MRWMRLVHQMGRERAWFAQFIEHHNRCTFCNFNQKTPKSPPALSQKNRTEGHRLSPETRKEYCVFLGILFAKKGDTKNHDFLSLSCYDPPFSSTPSTNIKLPQYPPKPQNTHKITHKQNNLQYSTYHQHISPHPIPSLTPPCHSNTQSCTKPYGKSPTSSAAMAMTGTSSAPTPPTPQERHLNHHHCNQCHQLTRSPKSKGGLLSNHYYL